MKLHGIASQMSVILIIPVAKTSNVSKGNLQAICVREVSTAINKFGSIKRRIVTGYKNATA
jgi:hypothetical protein